METSAPEKLLIDLTASLEGLKEILQGVDLELPAYQDSEWRIREILVHLATWDQQVTKSIRAFAEGSEYSIPNLDLNTFNQDEIDKVSSLSNEQVVEYWEKTRGEFKDAVKAVPVEIFSEDLLYPWGNERGTVSLLVSYMVEHDNEHKEGIVKAAQ